MSWQGGNYKLTAYWTACLWRTVLVLGTQSCTIFFKWRIWNFTSAILFLKLSSSFCIQSPSSFQISFPAQVSPSCSDPFFLTQLWGLQTHTWPLTPSFPRLPPHRDKGHGSSGCFDPDPSAPGTFAPLSSTAEGFGGTAGEQGANPSGDL